MASKMIEHAPIMIWIDFTIVLSLAFCSMITQLEKIVLGTRDTAEINKNGNKGLISIHSLPAIKWNTMLAVNPYTNMPIKHKIEMTNNKEKIN